MLHLFILTSLLMGISLLLNQWRGHHSSIYMVGHIEKGAPAFIRAASTVVGSATISDNSLRPTLFLADSFIIQKRRHIIQAYHLFLGRDIRNSNEIMLSIRNWYNFASRNRTSTASSMVNHMPAGDIAEIAIVIISYVISYTKRQCAALLSKRH